MSYSIDKIFRSGGGLGLLVAACLMGCWADGINPPSDSDEIFIEGGSFWMGSESGNRGDGYCYNDKAIRRCVVLSSFGIDKTEVTNLQYRHCVERGYCDEQEFTNSGAYDDYRDNSRYDHFPAVHVTWAQAKTYCEFRGKRLPSEAEWEFVAKSRGKHSDVPGGHPNHSWGNQTPNDCNYANIDKCTMRKHSLVEASPVEVDSIDFGQDVTEQGVMHMMGNVREWVEDWYSETAYCAPDPEQGDFDPCDEPQNPLCYYSCELGNENQAFCRKPAADVVHFHPINLTPDHRTSRVIRGGSFMTSIMSDIQTGSRDNHRPSTKDSLTGFRCVRELGAEGESCLINEQCASRQCSSQGLCTAWTAPSGCEPDPGPSALP